MEIILIFNDVSIELVEYSLYICILPWAFAWIAA